MVSANTTEDMLSHGDKLRRQDTTKECPKGGPDTD